MATAPHGNLRALRAQLVGWLLFVASMITPTIDLGSIGAYWLGAAPFYGALFLVQPHSSKPYDFGTALVGISLLCGFAANLFVFLKTSRAATMATLALPWLPFVAWMWRWRAGELPSPPWTLLHFYPWVVGISLICASRLYLSRSPSRELNSVVA